jgi:hypothetical protein
MIDVKLLKSSIFKNPTSIPTRNQGDRCIPGCVHPRPSIITFNIFGDLNAEQAA